MSDGSLILKLLEDRSYKPNYIPKKGSVVFKIRNENIGSLGNIVLVSGLPKAGKTKFILPAISTAFKKGSDLFQMQMSLANKNKLIAIFDTENSEDDFYDNLNALKRYSKLESLPDNFHAFATREDTYKTNRQMIETYIEHFKPSIVVIDHLLDLVKNYNDEVESIEIVSWLKKITKQFNVLIVGILHTGKKDGFTLGHYGSMLDRAAQSVLEVVKDKENGLFILKAKMLRKAADFDDIAIMWNGSEYIEVLAPAPKKNR